jgi:hypothetical protein
MQSVARSFGGRFRTVHLRYCHTTVQYSVRLDSASSGCRSRALLRQQPLYAAVNFSAAVDAQLATVIKSLFCTYTHDWNDQSPPARGLTLGI